MINVKLVAGKPQGNHVHVRQGLKKKKRSSSRGNSTEQRQRHMKVSSVFWG